jgi:hypothetical protein
VLFKIKKPCEHCPFRRDVEPFLTTARAEDLGRQLHGDDQSWFACHETTGVKGPKRVPRAKQSHCAGAMIVLWREKRTNVATRLALVFGMISREQLDAPAPVFDSMEEFVKHHAGNWRNYVKKRMRR